MAITNLGLGIVKKEPPKRVEAKDIYEWFGNQKKIQDKVIVTDEALALINESISNPEFDGFRFIDTMVTYQSAIANCNKVNLEDYVNAIRFCSFLEVTDGNATNAYIKAFFHRDFIQERYLKDKDSAEYKQITSAAVRYKKSPLVVNILTQAEVPLYLMFQGYRYKAIARLIEEMDKAHYSRDRINAADKLLLHLKPPENVKIELDLGVKPDNIVNEYEAMLENMVKEQKKLLQNGANVNEVTNARHTYVDAELIKDA